MPDPENYTSQLLQIPDPTTYINTQIAAGQQQQQNANVLQQQQLDMQKAQDAYALQQRQQAAAQQAWQSYQQNPQAPGALEAVGALAPNLFKGIQDVHVAKTADEQRSDLLSYSGIQGQAAAALDPQASDTSKAAASAAVVNLLQDRVRADIQGKRPSDTDQAILDQAKGGDVRGALAASQIMLRGVMGDKYADVYNAQTAASKAPSEIASTLAATARDDAAAPGKIALTAAQTAEANASGYKTVKNADGSENIVAVGSAAGDGGQPPASTGQATSLSGNATYTPPTTVTRGVRNNNLGNLKALPKGQQWQGQTGVDAAGYATFDTPENGARAAMMNLQSYGHRGVNTPLAIANRWAPKSDNNDTATYAKAIAATLGVSPTQKLNLADSNTAAQVVGAIFKQENGGTVTGPAPQAGPSSGAPAADGSSQGARVVYQAPQTDAPLSPDAIEQVAQQYLMTGTLPPLGMGHTATVNRDAVLNMAAQIQTQTGKTGYDAVATHATIKANTQSLSKMTALQNQVAASEQTVQSNMQIVSSLAPKGAGPTGSPLLNAPIQYLRKNVWGSEGAASYQAAIGTVADEYAKVMTASSGTGGPTSDSARNEAYSRLNGAQTIGQAQQVMQTMRQEMANRKASLDGQVAQITGTIRGGGAAPASQGSPVQATTPQQVMALPAGTPFIWSDGSHRVKH